MTAALSLAGGLQMSVSEVAALVGLRVSLHVRKSTLVLHA